MRVFLDTDILLDVLLNRQPHYAASAEVLDWLVERPGSAAISWHGAANLHYLSKDGAGDFLRELLEFVDIPRTGARELVQALDLGFADLEDAMQVSAALVFGAQVIVTRNGKTFRRSPIRSLTPAEALRVLR
jgi:predicted nucleic acid-binding protein